MSAKNVTGVYLSVCRVQVHTSAFIFQPSRCVSRIYRRMNARLRGRSHKQRCAPPRIHALRLAIGAGRCQPGRKILQVEGNALLR